MASGSGFTASACATATGSSPWTTTLPCGPPLSPKASSPVSSCRWLNLASSTSTLPSPLISPSLCPSTKNTKTSPATTAGERSLPAYCSPTLLASPTSQHSNPTLNCTSTGSPAPATLTPVKASICCNL